MEPMRYTCKQPIAAFLTVLALSACNHGGNTVIARSGALVFAAGSIDWDLGLDDYGVHPGDVLGRSRGAVPAVQQLTRNFLERAAQTPAVQARAARLPAAIAASPQDAGIQLDFGTSMWVQQLHWQTKPSAAAASLTRYKIEISTDGALWQTIIKRAATLAGGENHELLNQQARYLRLTPLQATRAGLTPDDFVALWAEGAPPPPSARLRALSSGPISENGFSGYQIDLGARQQITRIGWTADSAGASSASTRVQVADSGNDWQTVLSLDTVVNGAHTLALGAQGRYLRILAASAGVRFTQLHAAGTSVASVLGAEVHAQSATPQYPAANAAGGAGQPWLADTNPSPENNHRWIQLDFGARRQIDRLQWNGCQGSPDNAQSPADYSIQVSDDGSAWKTILVRHNSRPVVSGDELLNVEARYLRLVTAKVGDGSGWPLGLLAIWAEGY